MSENYLSYLRFSLSDSNFQLSDKMFYLSNKIIYLSDNESFLSIDNNGLNQIKSFPEIDSTDRFERKNILKLIFISGETNLY